VFNLDASNLNDVVYDSSNIAKITGSVDINNKYRA